MSNLRFYVHDNLIWNFVWNSLNYKENGYQDM